MIAVKELTRVRALIDPYPWQESLKPDGTMITCSEM